MLPLSRKEDAMTSRALILLGLLSVVRPVVASDDYTLGPDSQPQPGVPKGRVLGPLVWKSTVFANTFRQYWIYVPAQYDAGKPAALMVFQDGHKYVSTEEEYRVPVVFDNLIHKGQMPVTIALFVNPGHNSEQFPDRWRESNRANQYDALVDQYAQFLIAALIPEIAKTYKPTADPEGLHTQRASTGAICACAGRAQ